MNINFYKFSKILEEGMMGGWLPVADERGMADNYNNATSEGKKLMLGLDIRSSDPAPKSWDRLSDEQKKMATKYWHGKK
jgi:hypothetical protein